MMKKITGISIAALLLALLFTANVSAKDDTLETDMALLERAYIPALFLTSLNKPEAVGKMAIYVQVWSDFYSSYWDYRRSDRNWNSYLDLVQETVEEADELIAQGELLEAHEVLERIRVIMADFRGRNGFPKFTPDSLTDFHSIMGQIIAIASGEVGEVEIDQLWDLYKKASFAWSKVEKIPLDQALWEFSDLDMEQYATFVAAERLALDAFEAALLAEDPATMTTTALGLKPYQAQAYLLFGDL